HLTDVTSALAEMCLAGPRCFAVLAALSAFDMDHQLPESACAETNLAGVHAVLARPANLPVPLVRICVAWDQAEHVWDRLFEVGREFDVIPIGLDSVKSFMPLGYP